VPSGLTWLDSSLEDQRRMREILGMFAEAESRDELGIGQVRDAFSDLLFPGTSTLHTRARYLLLVPWCYRDAAGKRGAATAARVERTERRLVDVLRKAGETDGLIGRVAGVHVKTLPSSIYRSALERYGIRISDDDTMSWPETSEAGELVERGQNAWHHTLPPAPAGFPDEVAGGLRLTGDEARWLRERIVNSSPESLLAHLLNNGHRPAGTSAAPWDDPSALDAPEPAASQLLHARRFSVCMHGAALLYNLLIGERYEKAGFTEVVEPTVAYRGSLDEWAGRVNDLQDLSGWNRQQMWDFVIAQNPRIASNGFARRFVDRWLDAVVTGEAASPADADGLRKLVAAREQAIKKAQSRLSNDKLLASWSGGSGSNQLVFRWPQVKRTLTDVHDGCELAEEEEAGDVAA
jgi:hypothetical protein